MKMAMHLGNFYSILVDCKWKWKATRQTKQKKSQPVVFFNFLQKTALKEKDAAGLASHRHVVPLNISLTLNLQGKKTFFLVIKNTVHCILTR